VVEEKVLNIFSEILGELTKNDEIESFLSDFLSPTERMMLAKRLTVALLLSKDYNYEEICNLLKVSADTVARVSLWLHRKSPGFSLVIQKVFAKEKRREFLMDLEKLLAKMITAHPAAWTRIDRKVERNKRDSKLW